MIPEAIACAPRREIFANRLSREKAGYPFKRNFGRAWRFTLTDACNVPNRIDAAAERSVFIDLRTQYRKRKTAEKPIYCFNPIASLAVSTRSRFACCQRNHGGQGQPPALVTVGSLILAVATRGVSETVLVINANLIASQG